jgi:uncharacterized protein (DUF2237 family)
MGSHTVCAVTTAAFGIFQIARVVLRATHEGALAQLGDLKRFAVDLA